MQQVWTIGHWTHRQEAFLDLLGRADIEIVADVRAHPGSRTSPQFGTETMAAWLADAGLDYLHLADLGGRRRRQDVDPGINAAWNNVSFKNYADYTGQPAFRRGMTQLTELAAERRVVVMCAELLPWRCHRLLISNALVATGWTVLHIIDQHQPKPHELGQWGAVPVVDDVGRLTYPPPSISAGPAATREPGP